MLIPDVFWIIFNEIQNNSAYSVSKYHANYININIIKLYLKLICFNGI